MLSTSRRRSLCWSRRPIPPNSKVASSITSCYTFHSNTSLVKNPGIQLPGQDPKVNKFCSILKHHPKNFPLHNQKISRNSPATWWNQKTSLLSNNYPQITWTTTSENRRVNVPHMSDPDLSQHAPVPTGSATHGFQATKTSLPHKTMQKLCQ